MSLTITVNGGGTFTAGITSGPATFTANFGSVPGPQGDTGPAGPTGPAGAAGTAASVTVGSVVTLGPGDPATVVNSGTSSAAILDFGIPEGIQGAPGVVAATAPLSYTAGTQTVSIDTSGFLLKADNLSGLANLATSRTNLGLGTTDTVSFGEVRIPSPDNHAKLDVYMWRPFSAAHGDFGIEYRGDKIKFADASEQTSAYVGGDLKAASNLSDLASASTARTNLDVYSKSESDGLVPDASTTAKGKVELATDAEAVAGTSSTLAVTPAALRAMVTYPGLTAITTYSLTAATSGASASSFRQGTSNGWVVRGPTTAIGYAVGKTGLVNSRRGGEFTSRLDWSKPCAITARCTLNPNGTIDANSIFRMSVGKGTADNAGDISSGDGIQIKVAGGGAIQLLACASGTVTTVTSSFTPVNDETFDVGIHSDGSGNVTLYVNGSSVATTTGGPTTSSALAYNNAWHIEVENINTLTDSFAAYCVNNAYIHSEG
jgi:hypothetical protein